MVLRKEMELGGRKLAIEVGKVAKQADGAAWVQYGETIILATVVSRRERSENTDFFPLTVDYREKKYAAGKVPGGFFKREGRPHDKEILNSRMIDRPLRPLFPKGYYHETQVLVSVLSFDGENEGDILGTIGASTALLISDIPFNTGVGAVTVGRMDGKLILNPTLQQVEESDLHILVTGTKEAIVMVEGEAHEASEEVFLEALDFAHENIKKLIDLQEEIKKAVGKPDREWEPVMTPEEITSKVVKLVGGQVDEIIRIAEKSERRTAEKELAARLIEEFGESAEGQEKLIKWALEDLIKDAMRKRVLDERVRLDGRGLKDIRPISVETGLLPRAHGSALFTRGQTQALATCTLGSKMDEQKIDDLAPDYWKTFMLHYNFPPFSVGEVRRFLAPGRRETGHGNLAERAIKAVLPEWEDFPYTVRIVSDILESNGSSSMATVCAGCLSAMDAGVPMKTPVAGIAMGLIKEGDKYVILTDILGDEDHLGDMDFKVAGSREGITAFQMDIKIAGITREIMAEALAQAKEARLQILDIMAEALPEPRPEMSPYAPRIRFLSIDPEVIGQVIGPGGRVIRALQTEYDVNIDIDDDGTVCISSPNQDGVEEALKIIQGITSEPEIGSVYDAKVVKITDFGAFCELFPGKEGLLHISEIEHHRINRVEDVLKVGDKVQVKLIKITPEGKLDLSRKALLPKPEGYVESDQRPRHSGGGRHRDNRDRHGSGKGGQGGGRGGNGGRR